MNDSIPDGGIRPSTNRLVASIAGYAQRRVQVETVAVREANRQLRSKVAQLSIEVDRLQMENAELRYERDAARLARVIPDSDGYSDGEAWAS